MLNKFTSLATAILLVLNLSACVDDGNDGVNGVDGQAGADGVNGVSTYITRTDVVTTNANIAYAAYADSLLLANKLKSSRQILVNESSQAHFDNAKQAWLGAREPYGQSEVYRFRSGPIDALKPDGTLSLEGEGPEGRINAWPLGEAMIELTLLSYKPTSSNESFKHSMSVPRVYTKTQMNFNS